jgi:uncharacterized protein
MLSLRADPWIPDFGMGYQARLDETPARADPLVETEDWSVPITQRTVEPGTVWFVDGVRRVELRLIAGDEHGRHAPGLFGSFAVGAVRCDGRATVAEHSLGRSVVVGGGLRPEPVEIRVGGVVLVYHPATEPSGDPDAPLFGLQKVMMAQEAALASRIAAGRDELVLVDGRLGFLDDTRSPVVGVVKRFVRAYLDPDQDGLLPQLAPGERTPLFALVYEGQPLERYAWYTRLVRSRREWHDHAGLVRCEVRVGIGLEGARSLADRVSALLPGFAGRPFDPRFPQNLVPVAGLERFLQHRLGHRELIRRALVASLAEEAA